MGRKVLRVVHNSSRGSPGGLERDGRPSRKSGTSRGTLLEVLATRSGPPGGSLAPFQTSRRANWSVPYLWEGPPTRPGLP